MRPNKGQIWTNNGDEVQVDEVDDFTVQFHYLTGILSGSRGSMGHGPFVSIYTYRDLLAEQTPKIKEGETWRYKFNGNDFEIIRADGTYVIFRRTINGSGLEVEPQERFLVQFSKVVKLPPTDKAHQFVYVEATSTSLVGYLTTGPIEKQRANVGVLKVPIAWDLATWEVEP